jgi:lipopolysaccharide transport system permease protein
MSLLPNRKTTVMANHFDLLRQLVVRDILARYKGALLGLSWAAISPLALLGIYSFVFGYIFKARWTAGEDTNVPYAIVLFVGLILHSLISEVFSRAPSVIAAQSNLVKKVVFPLYLLPLVIVGSGLFQLVISFFIWTISASYFEIFPNWVWLLAPMILLPLAIFACGISWLVASLGVFIKDISQFSGLFATLLLFLSPIFYQIDSLPKFVQGFIYINPLTVPVLEMQSLLFKGSFSNYEAIAMYNLASIVFSLTSLFLFEKIKPSFSEVL